MVQLQWSLGEYKWKLQGGVEDGELVFHGYSLSFASKQNSGDGWWWWLYNNMNGFSATKLYPWSYIKWNTVVYFTQWKNGGRFIWVVSGITMSSQPEQPCLSFSQLRSRALYLWVPVTIMLTIGISEVPIFPCKYQLISDLFSKAPPNPAKASCALKH